MDQLRRTSLEREIKIINNITIKAQEAYLIVKYLETKEEHSDIMYQKRFNPFFYYTRVTFWQITIIELAKLLKEKEKFSLFKIINKVKADGEYSQANIPITKISEWENILSTYRDAIENLKLQRDKIYVHEDGTGDINNLIQLSTISIFLDLAKDIILTLGKTLDLAHKMFDVINSPAKSLEFAITQIVKKKIEEMEDYRELAKKYNLENELPKKL